MEVRYLFTVRSRHILSESDLLEILEIKLKNQSGIKVGKNLHILWLIMRLTTHFGKKGSICNATIN